LTVNTNIIILYGLGNKIGIFINFIKAKKTFEALFSVIWKRRGLSFIHFRLKTGEEQTKH